MPLPGLIGWWQLLEGSGIVAADSSGNGNNGTLLGSTLPTWVTDGPNGGGLSFSGSATEERVDIPRVPLLEPSAICMCCWFKNAADAVNLSNHAVVSKTIDNDVGPLFSSYQIAINHATVDSGNLYGLTGGIPDLTSHDGLVSNEVWVFSAYTYDPASTAPQQNLYYNGILVGSQTATAAIPYDTTPAGDFIIGASGNPVPFVTRYYSGEITDVQLYNRVLTASEVDSLYRVYTKVDTSTVRGPHRGSRITPPYNP